MDLHFPEPELHPRFLQRVFSTSERRILKDSSPEMWLNWAAKEAAFKAVKRLRQHTEFIPTAFELDRQSSCVIFDNQALPCELVLTDRFAAALCATSPGSLADTKHWIEEVGMHEVPLSTSWHSQAVRSLAVNHIAGTLQTPSASLSFSRSYSLGEVTHPPILFVCEAPTNHLFSFSHHGMFVACAFLRQEK